MDYKKILPHLFEGAYIVDDNRKIVHWNQEAERITGYSQNEVIGKYCYDNILRHMSHDGTLLCHQGCPLKSSIETGDINEAYVALHHKKGYRVPVFVRTIPFMDDTTKQRMALELFSETHRRKNMAEENKNLKKELLQDPLTQIYNRRFMDYQLELAIDEFKTFGTTLGLLFIDIDHFKRVNDQYGHDAGDKVLSAVAQTLALNVRSSDYVGRYGGEEFIALLRGVNPQEMRLMAERLRLLIAEASMEIDASTSIAVTISIGCAYYQDDGTKASLLKTADQNMYQAKQTGRNKVVSS